MYRKKIYFGHLQDFAVRNKINFVQYNIYLIIKPVKFTYGSSTFEKLSIVFFVLRSLQTFAVIAFLLFLFFMPHL